MIEDKKRETHPYVGWLIHHHGHTIAAASITTFAFATRKSTLYHSKQNVKAFPFLLSFHYSSHQSAHLEIIKSEVDSNGFGNGNQMQDSIRTTTQGHHHHLTPRKKKTTHKEE